MRALARAEHAQRDEREQRDTEYAENELEADTAVFYARIAAQSG